ncbi:MAG: YraN family protein [Burkholderiales bacterium]|jgi:putative endonuclease|nr:YraN family protein [Burkholderiales bacterium]
MIFKRTPQQKDGDTAEAIAASYLTQQGLLIVAKNVKNRFGEIDIIARDGKTLVFVEVRYRRGDVFGGAVASIDERKQKRMIAAAKCYLSTLARLPPCRFDAILMGALNDKNLQWQRNVFSVS